MPTIILPARNEAATCCASLKILAPVALTFSLVGIGYYVFNFLSFHRVSLSSVALWGAAEIIFLIGLISEQITSLIDLRDA